MFDHFLYVYQSVDKAFNKQSVCLSLPLPASLALSLLSLSLSLSLFHFECKLKFHPCFVLKMFLLLMIAPVYLHGLLLCSIFIQQELTSHCPWAAWCLSCIFQSSVLGSAQWCKVRTTGRVSRAPRGPQLTTGVKSVCVSSMGGLGGEQRTASVTFPSYFCATYSENLNLKLNK